MLHLQELVQKYQEACKAIKDQIKASRYKAAWFIDGLGFSKSPSAYYRRLQRADWTPEELFKLAALLEGKEASI